jgi:hypothetical protein
MGESGEQNFRYQEISGYRQNHTRTADPDNPLLPGGTNGGDLAWGPENRGFYYDYDAIKAQWIGQTYSGGKEFSNTAYIRNTEGNNPTDYLLGETRLTRFDDPEPAAWVDPFGAAPAMNIDHTVEATVTAPPPTAPSPTIAVKAPLVGTGPSGPPIAFDGWSVTDGDISLAVDCPDGAVCGTPIIEKGFMQREVVKDGVRYYQTIITDSSATGAPNTTADSRVAAFAVEQGGLGFAEENFVRADGVSGIASKQEMAEANLLNPDDLRPNSYGSRTAFSTQLNTGWAQGGPANPVLNTNQAIFSNVALVNFKSFYDMQVGQDGSKDIYIRSQVPWLTNTFPIDFATRIIQGGFQNSSHTAGAGTPLLSAGSNGGDISWVPGESIQVTWNGSKYTTWDYVTQNHYVNALTYKNLTTGEETSSTDVRYLDRSLDSIPDPNPESWVLPFGAAPVWTWMIPYNGQPF